MTSSSVVVVDPGLGPILPATALAALRAADVVYAAPDVPADFRAALGVEPAPADALADRAVALVAVDPHQPLATELLAAGALLVTAPPFAGAGLLGAVGVMDRLRSPGGCPWDAEQTHESLRQYLVEETYELLEAIEDGDRAALREELGDVLLQVLFHARIAAESASDPFTVDDVAEDLVGKLVGRHPHVFADGDPAVRDAASQQHRWEELKQAEKRRTSSVDGVALGQPALGLAAKLIQRATRAGLPADLLPTGDALFAAAVAAKLGGTDPEGALRATARRFADRLRAAERAARDAGLDPLALDADAWRKFWPAGE